MHSGVSRILKKEKSLKAIRVKSQHSLDSIPELRDPRDLDPFDRSKTPDPKSPHWQGTLVHALKVDDTLSKASEFIETYYSSKHERRAEDENGGSEHVSPDGSSASSCLEVLEQSTRKSEELKRNSILFPNLSQEEIDARILYVCESR